TQASAANRPLAALWARKWVGILEDQVHMGGGRDVEQAITDLGLSYKLLTPYTSFVAIDSVVTNRGTTETVRQPLPLPQGVSNLAVSRGGGRAQQEVFQGGQPSRSNETYTITERQPTVDLGSTKVGTTKLEAPAPAPSALPPAVPQQIAA